MEILTLLDGVEAVGASEVIKIVDILRDSLNEIPVHIYGTTIPGVSATAPGLDDCTSGGKFTGIVATNYQAKIDAIAAIAAVAFDGIGLDDATSGGTFVGATDLDYQIVIDALAAISVAVQTGSGLDDCVSGGAFTGNADTDYQIKIDAIAAIAAASQTTGIGLNDCTSGGAFSGNTDLTYIAKCDAVRAIAAAVITGAGLNDCTSGGTYTGPSDLTYVVEIDATGTPDTLQWSKDGGSTWEATGVAIVGGAMALDNGVTVTFGATTGHTLGDLWTIECTVDTFTWSDDGGGTWDTAGVSMTGAAQTLNNGVELTFAAVVGHTLNDAWTIAATVDTFKWSNDAGSSWEATGVSLTGSAQTLELGLTVTFAAVVGHNLNDLWNIACTLAFVGTVLIEGTLATGAEIALGTAKFSTLISKTAEALDEVEQAYTHIRARVSAYTSGTIWAKVLI